jgi:hypothetical protein
MNGFAFLDVLATTFTLGANVVVAGTCHEAFRRLRVPALRWIGLSATVAVFSSVANLLLLRKTGDEAAYAVLWTGLHVLWMVDVGLYAFGVTRLIQWISARKRDD